MSVQQQCLSCEHLNPAEAKFCQECGSALNLKLCKQCEAINEAKAARCHKCDAAFVIAKPAASPTVAPKTSRNRVVAALGVAVLIGGAIALYAGTRSKPAAAVAVKPPAAQSVPVAMQPPKPAAEKQHTLPESAPARSTGVTHTRTAGAASRPAAARAPVARSVAPEAPAASPAAPSSPPSTYIPVTHTKRAVVATPTKSETP